MQLTLFTLIFATTFAFGETTYQRIGGVPANNLCDAGSVFRTLQPVSVCDEWSHKPEVSQGEAVQPAEWKCVTSRMTNLDISKAIIECAKFVTNEAETGCVAWENGIQGNKVLGQRITEYGQATNVEYFDYIIPACK